MAGSILMYFFLVSILNICYSAGEKSTSLGLGEPLVLTPYIEKGNLEKAHHLSKYNILGWTGHAGFLTVDKECGGHLFFTFIPAKNNSKHAPLLLWLNGGPGSSSMYGFLVEIGPFKYINASYIERRNVTWNSNSNILYIDQPIGVGYSFPKNSCLPGNITASTKQLYTGLVQFFQLFPEYQKNDFYLTGQSYAGHYNPILGVLIHKMNQKADRKVKINFKGMMVGNPSTRPDCSNYAHYLYNLGLVSAKVRDELDERYFEFIRLTKAGKFLEAYYQWKGTLAVIRVNARLESFNYVLPDPEQIDWIDCSPWLESREAHGHFKAGNITYNDFSQQLFDNFLEDITRPADSYVEDLLNNNYTCIFYSGNVDLTCQTTSTDCLVQSLNWWGAEEFKKVNQTPWFYNESTAGYFQHYENLAFVVISGAGHSVPAYKPLQAYQLLKTLFLPCKGDLLCHLNTTVPWL